MAKLSFCVVLFAYLLFQVFSEELSPQQQLEALQSSFEIDVLVRRARSLSADIISIMAETEKAYIDNVIRSPNAIRSIVSSGLNASIKTINETYAAVLAEVNLVGKQCVSSAQSSLNLQISAASKATVNCTISAILNLFNFATQLSSIETGSKKSLAAASYDALSKCPSTFILSNSPDLVSAQKCYAEAADELKNYINRTSADLQTSNETLKALKQEASDCLSRGTLVATNEGKAVVDSMLSCLKIKGTFTSSAVASIYTGIEKLTGEVRNISANAYSNIASAYGSLNVSAAAIDSIEISVDTEINKALSSTYSLIEYVEQFLEGTPYPNEIACLDNVKQKFKVLSASAIISTKRCVDLSLANIDTLALNQAEIKVKAILLYATENAVAQCTSETGATESSVKNCLADALAKISADVTAVEESVKLLVESAKTTVSRAQQCVRDGAATAPRNGNIILDSLAECLAEEGITFTYDKAE